MIISCMPCPHPQLIWIGFSTLRSGSGDLAWADLAPVSYVGFQNQYLARAPAYFAARQCVALWWERGQAWARRQCSETRPYVCKKLTAAAVVAPPPPLPLYNNGGRFTYAFTYQVSYTSVYMHNHTYDIWTCTYQSDSFRETGKRSRKPPGCSSRPHRRAWTCTH